MGGVYFEEGKNYCISNDKYVKVTRYDNQNEIDILDNSVRMNPLKNIRKISKYEYKDLMTNRIYKYNLNEFKSPESVKKSMNKLRKLLNNNFFGNKNELFITLTTETFVKSDITSMNKYFKKFIRKLKKLYKDKKFEYVYVLESCTMNDDLHIHLLLKDINNRILHIENGIISQLWRTRLYFNAENYKFCIIPKY